MGRKKPKTTETYRLKREHILEQLHKEYGTYIKQLMDNGYTINDMFKLKVASRKMLHYYIEKYNLTELSNYNNIEKIKKVARLNGRKSAITLTGVERKPLTSEIKKWYVKVKKAGKFKGEITRELWQKFGYGRKKYDQLTDIYGIPSHNSGKGKLNNMYGKSPSKWTGRGIKCNLLLNGNNIFCRSLLELKIYLFLYKNNIKFELSKHHIKYRTPNNIDRTYNPDIVLLDYDTICEIKPKSLIKLPINKVKFEAAEQYCKIHNLTFKIITENSYTLGDITFEYILDLINNEVIIITDKNLKRLNNNKNEYNNTNSDIKSTGIIKRW